MSARARRAARPASDVATLRRIERLIVAARSQVISIGCDPEDDPRLLAGAEGDLIMARELIRRLLTQAGG